MTTEIIWRYVHFIGIFGVVAALGGEFLLLQKQMARKEIARLAKIDAVYGISSIIFVAAGLMLWLAVGKPADFYTQNSLFILKVGLAILLGLLSIPPTIYFIRQRKGNPEEIVDLPNYIFWLLRLELLLLFIIPLCAVFMAKGIGLE